ncbi:MAG: acyl-CoA dehydrogenase family protein [bacterium]|nr:acyl-CoA dehydrogenase family protein [bacterium]
MDFNLTPDQELIINAAKEVCLGEFSKRSKETGESSAFPKENVKLMAEMGMAGIPFPEEYGGLGSDFLTWTVIGEEISHACATTGTIFGAHMLACYPIFIFGTEEQKKKFLTPLAKGEALGAFGLTEPNAGSDASAVQTYAAKDGDHYILNGTKLFITNAGAAGIYVVITKTARDKGARGMTAFIVEKDTPGFKIGKNEKKMAFPGLPNCELIFEDCRIPKENMLLSEGKGFRVAMQTLDVGRIGIGIGSCGLARAAFEEALKYSKVRKQFGVPISSFQAVQFMLANMATEIEAAKLLVLKAASLKDSNGKFEKFAAMAKVYASEMCMRVTNQAVQIHGGYGYTKEYAVERYFREAKLFDIVEGTSEIQRGVIANHILKES